MRKRKPKASPLAPGDETADVHELRQILGCRIFLPKPFSTPQAFRSPVRPGGSRAGLGALGTACPAVKSPVIDRKQALSFTFLLVFFHFPCDFMCFSMFFKLIRTRYGPFHAPAVGSMPGTCAMPDRVEPCLQKAVSFNSNGQGTPVGAQQAGCSTTSPEMYTTKRKRYRRRISFERIEFEAPFAYEMSMFPPTYGS